jgi:hypothetical protein
MATYKATKGGLKILKNFADLAAAQAYFLAEVGSEYTVKLAEPSEQITERTDAEKLADRKEFGQSLVDRYLLDNDALAEARGYPLTVTESNQQSAKFQAVIGVLPLGSLRQALAIITATATDGIFTQPRKDAYILALNEFIDSQ